MNAFFDDLARRWVAAAKARGVEIEAPELDGSTAAELLELARVAAHSQERRFAPLASYMAGVAAERMRAGGSDEDPAELIREVRTALERDSESGR